tara:strand:+ start:214 stop:630 length:417 start_codon:yes stop_codon:yes gene_type:complete
MASKKKIDLSRKFKKKKSPYMEEFDIPMKPTIFKSRVAPEADAKLFDPQSPEEQKIIEKHFNRIIALEQGSRPVKARPMKGPPRKLKPELAKDAKARREKYKAGGPAQKAAKRQRMQSSKVSVRTSNNKLSKLVKAMK